MREGAAGTTVLRIDTLDADITLDLDMTLPRLPCAMLNFMHLEATGEDPIRSVGHKLYKQRLSKAGKPLGIEPEASDPPHSDVNRCLSSSTAVPDAYRQTFNGKGCNRPFHGFASLRRDCGRRKPAGTRSLLTTSFSKT